MTNEQRINCEKLIQTLRDIRDVEFFMPALRIKHLTRSTWVSWAADAYGDDRALRLADEIEEGACGTAACVAGWALNLGIIHGTSEWDLKLEEALGLTWDEINSLTVSGYEMTREQKADQLESMMRGHL